MDSRILPLTQAHIPEIVHAFEQIGWNKSASLFEDYLHEQNKGERLALVAFVGDIFAGYVTLKMISRYAPFQQNGIPEINDLNVLPQHRNQGIGTKLLEFAEDAAFKINDYVGLGVGLYADYGAAQRLYIKSGYIPNGKGITYDYMPVIPGTTYPVDDDLILWLTKKRDA